MVRINIKAKYFIQVSYPLSISTSNYKNIIIDHNSFMTIATYQTCPILKAKRIRIFSKWQPKISKKPNCKAYTKFTLSLWIRRKQENKKIKSNLRKYKLTAKSFHSQTSEDVLWQLLERLRISLLYIWPVVPPIKYNTPLWKTMLFNEDYWKNKTL